MHVYVFFKIILLIFSTPIFIPFIMKAEVISRVYNVLETIGYITIKRSMSQPQKIFHDK